MVIDRTCIAVPPASSVTMMVRLNVPAAVGVPEIAPVDKLSDRPGGREPANTDRV